MNRQDIENWLKETKRASYIDCGDVTYDDEEFNFIINMAEELLKRM